MTKIICFMAFLLTFLMQSVCVWSATQSVSPVYLYYKNTPKLDGTQKPSKSPANHYLSLSVSINSESQQLLMQDSSGEVYTYYILNDSDDIVSQGILDFSSVENQTVNLWAYLPGLYTLVIVHDVYTYCGTFGID